MQMVRRSIDPRPILLLILGALSITPNGVAAPANAHPRISRAITALKGAIQELKEAPHDFGGHRAQAIEALDEALRQLDLAVAYRPDREHRNVAFEAFEREPRLRKAIVALEGAIRELQAAPHDFGGHRIDAVVACQRAISQLKLAVEYDTGGGGKHCCKS